MACTCQRSTCFSLLWCSLITLISGCTWEIAAQTFPAWDRRLLLLVFGGSNSPLRSCVVCVWGTAAPLEYGFHLCAWIYVLAADIPAQDTHLPVVCGCGLSALIEVAATAVGVVQYIQVCHLLCNSPAVQNCHTTCICCACPNSRAPSDLWFSPAVQNCHTTCICCACPNSRVPSGLWFPPAVQNCHTILAYAVHAQIPGFLVTYDSHLPSRTVILYLHMLCMPKFQGS